ncbi:MAG TPA: hypothetical protein VFQ88_06845, partial [Nevskiaceae bacterium]|nr:hypothetical protein [Nevskiaceae bacterium]
MSLRLRHILMAVALHVVVFGFALVGVQCSRSVTAPATIQGVIVNAHQLAQMQAPSQQAQAVAAQAEAAAREQAQAEQRQVQQRKQATERAAQLERQRQAQASAAKAA